MEKFEEMFGNAKKAVMVPVYSFFKSERGNTCMRKAGPIIVVFFYLYQGLHLYFFLFHHISLLLEFYYPIVGPLVYVSPFA